MLEYDFFDIDDKTGNTFSVTLHSKSSVYGGHFPGYPVAPGVALLETVRECAEKIAGIELRMTKLNRCRFHSLLTMNEDRHLSVEVLFDEKGDELFFKASMTECGNKVLNAEGIYKRSEIGEV